MAAKVNFVIVGVQKCGTSSLLKLLNSHPNIYGYHDGKVNETHYFDKHYKYHDYEWYEKFI